MKKRIDIILTICTLLIWSFSNAQFSNPQREKIDVLAYSFTVEINDTTNIIKASATSRILLKQKMHSFFLQLKNINKDGLGMRVSAIAEASGIPLKYEHEDNKIRIYNPGNWKLGDTLQINISYSGQPEDGLYIKQNMYGKKTFFGDNWPNRAHYWLPVVDHPSDKAKVEFFISAPKHYQVIASGKLVTKSSLDASRNVFHYKTKVSLATKIMVFGAADFKIKEYDTYKGKVISSWVYKASPEGALDDYKPAVAVLKFYDSLLGPYAYEKLANVQSKTRFGGMENAGNIFYYEASANGKHQVESLVAHEVAHQWFGNGVSEEEWSDIWLSEGFATYLTDVYLEYKYGEEKMRERMSMEREKVIRYHKTKGVEAIVYTEKENLFKLLNRNSYEKGAWVLHMLRNRVGDATFFKILREFYAKYNGANAHTTDFIHIAEQLSEQNLQAFFKQWLFTAGIPSLKISHTIKKRHLKFRVEQQSMVYNLDLPIKLKSQTGEQIIILPIRKASQKFCFKNKLKQKDLKLILDPKVQVLFEAF